MFSLSRRTFIKKANCNNNNDKAYNHHKGANDDDVNANANANDDDKNDVVEPDEMKKTTTMLFPWFIRQVFFGSDMSTMQKKETNWRPSPLSVIRPCWRWKRQHRLVFVAVGLILLCIRSMLAADFMLFVQQNYYYYYSYFWMLLLLSPPKKPKFNYCTTYRVDAGGQNWTMVHVPERDAAPPPPPPTTNVSGQHDYIRRNLEHSIKLVVQNLGPFEGPLEFDLSTQELPNCDSAAGGGGTTKGEWNSGSSGGGFLDATDGRPHGECSWAAVNCCQPRGGGGGGRHRRPLFGIAKNICCPCSVALPLHANQELKALKKILTVADKKRDEMLWEDKLPMAIWRGAPAGNLDHTRFYAAKFNPASSKGWSWGPPIDDPKNITLTPRQVAVHVLAKQYPNLFTASFVEENEGDDQEETAGSTMDWSDMLRYKYIVSISGESYADLLKPALASNSCVLRQNAIATEWYEDSLVPWVHYVPVRYDLSDLISRIRWAIKNDAKCRKIALNGQMFARQHFSPQAINQYMYQVLLAATTTTTTTESSSD